MPVFRSGRGNSPPWCEVENFDIVTLHPGDQHRYERIAQREKLFVCSGRCRVRSRDAAREAGEGDLLELVGDDGTFHILDVFSHVTLVRVCGHWGSEVGSSGTFCLDNSKSPRNEGDPVAYPRMTRFDNHFHDCDEYLILCAGRMIAVSERKVYQVGPGDCLVTGRGHHHDLPLVIEPARGIYFEATLAGQKRTGHLWEHAHGPAHPDMARI